MKPRISQDAERQPIPTAGASADKRKLPPVIVGLYVRDTDNSPSKERRLNEGVSAETVESFTLPAEGVRRRKRHGIISMYSRITLGGSVVLAVLAALNAVVTSHGLQTIDITPFIVAFVFLAAAVVSIAVGVTAEMIQTKSETRDKLASADLAAPHLRLMPLRLTDNDEKDFNTLLQKLETSRRQAAYTPAREEELFAAIRALADYQRTPAPDATAERMNNAVKTVSDPAVEQLAKEYREARALKDDARHHAIRGVHSFTQHVEIENLVTKARGIVAAR